MLRIRIEELTASKNPYTGLSLEHWANKADKKQKANSDQYFNDHWTFTDTYKAGEVHCSREVEISGAASEASCG